MRWNNYVERFNWIDVERLSCRDVNKNFKLNSHRYRSEKNIESKSKNDLLSF